MLTRLRFGLVDPADDAGTMGSRVLGPGTLPCPGVEPVVEGAAGEDAGAAGVGGDPEVLGVVLEGVGDDLARVVDGEAADDLAGGGVVVAVAGVSRVDDVEPVARVVEGLGGQVGG